MLLMKFGMILYQNISTHEVARIENSQGFKYQEMEKLGFLEEVIGSLKIKWQED